MSFVRVQAMTTEIRCACGEKRESGFDVVNATDRMLRIGIEPIGPAKDWVQLDASLLELSLPPRGQQKVKVSLELPASASGTQSSFKLRVYKLDDPSQAIESADVGLRVEARVEPKAPVREAPATAPPTAPVRWPIYAAIAAVAVLSVSTISYFVLRDPGTPELVGLTRDAALEVLADSDLTASESEERTGATVGQVIRQQPVAGEPLPADKVVKLVIEGAAASTAKWEPLDGNVTSDLDVSSWGPGRLDVFARGVDDALWHKSYENGWSSWEQLGGGLTSGVAAVSWSPSRIDVFALGGDSRLWHRAYAINQWYPWDSPPGGGPFTSDPAVASWAPGRLDMFVRGPDNTLHHNWYDQGWGQWESLGGQLTSSPAAVSWGPDRIDVFARGLDNTLIHKWWEGYWSEWESLGGRLSSGPSVSSRGRYRLDVFARSEDGQLIHKEWDSSAWSEWKRVERSIDGDPASVSWDPTRIDLIARSPDGTPQHIYYSGDVWHP